MNKESCNSQQILFDSLLCLARSIYCDMQGMECNKRDRQCTLEIPSSADWVVCWKFYLIVVWVACTVWKMMLSVVCVLLRWKLTLGGGHTYKNEYTVMLWAMRKRHQKQCYDHQMKIMDMVSMFFCMYLLRNSPISTLIDIILLQ